MTTSEDASTKRAGDEGEVALQRLVRARMDREADLIIQRTTSMLASQAFLFTAYGVAVSGHPDPPLWHRWKLLIAMIPWISVASLLLFQLTIWGGIMAGVRLRRYLTPTDDPRIRVLDVGRPARILGMTGPVLIPLMLLVTWLALLADR